MFSKYYYWYFESALSDAFCDKVIERGLSLNSHFALTGQAKIKDLKTNKNLQKEIKKKRNSNVTWFNDQWVYDEILPYVQTANKNAGWDFEFDWSENCQFTIYKKGQYYGWHADAFREPTNEPNNLNFHNKIRKLSVTVCLSDPSNYKGGDLQFDYREQDPDKPQEVVTCVEARKRGSIIVFPSYVWHRVQPVTKGTRYSLVIWNKGYPFK